MLIIHQYRIYRKDLKANPNILYIFGDNLVREGYGGQAKEMRGEANAFGIATKRKPSHNYYEDYFHDGQADVKEILIHEFNNLHINVRKNKYYAIVIPLEGIGTGLAQLSKYAPETLKFIEENLKELKYL